MQLAEIMQKNVKTIRPEATLQEAGQEMAKYDIGSLVVINGSGKLVGIITDSDIIKKAVADGDDTSKVKVSEIMTKDVIVADPKATLEEAADVMIKYKIKHLPVIDKGEVVGMVTGTDLITYEDALIEKVAGLLTLKRGDGADVGG